AGRPAPPKALRVDADADDPDRLRDPEAADAHDVVGLDRGLELGDDLAVLLRQREADVNGLGRALDEQLHVRLLRPDELGHRDPVVGCVVLAGLARRCGARARAAAAAAAAASAATRTAS